MDNIKKNNIIIAGVPRAGKSTISHMISRKYGYQHISMDSIIAGFERVFPELGISTYADMSSFEILCNISGKIVLFINAMMESGEYDEFDRGMVLDIWQLLPEDYVKHINNNFCDIYYFVMADISGEELFSLLKKYDTENDYTYYKPEQELREACITIVKQSKFIKEQCIKYNLPCYEMSKDRNKIIEQFIESLSINHA
jgi:hypothetical protein